MDSTKPRTTRFKDGSSLKVTKSGTYVIHDPSVGHPPATVQDVSPKSISYDKPAPPRPPRQS